MLRTWVQSVEVTGAWTRRGDNGVVWFGVGGGRRSAERFAGLAGGLGARARSRPMSGALVLGRARDCGRDGRRGGRAVVWQRSWMRRWAEGRV